MLRLHPLDDTWFQIESKDDISSSSRCCYFGGLSVGPHLFCNLLKGLCFGHVLFGMFNIICYTCEKKKKDLEIQLVIAIFHSFSIFSSTVVNC